MSFAEILRLAFRALLRNKMRSFLTALGLIIGVAAVIAMVAIGEGAKASVDQAFASMGSNLLIVMSGSTKSGGARGGFGSQPTLTWDDARAITSEVRTVRFAAPALRTNAQLASEDQNWSTSVLGTTPEYFDIRNWPMAEGDRFSPADTEGGAKVVILGQTVVDHLFGAGVSPLGRSLRIKNIPFQVIGVAARKGLAPTGQDSDDSVFIPAKTFQTKIQGGLGKFLAGVLLISATSAEDTHRAELDITSLLRERHHLPADADDDFSVRNLAELATARQEGTRTLTLLLASIAAVSLLVGGVGIMNIMLVSVTERTREIGVRMAIGARPADILLQFLVEALTLSTAGGLAGVAVGVGVAERLSAKFNWPMLIRPDAVVVSVVFSALIGIVFGLYPARKAARLDPIDALRFE